MYKEKFMLEAYEEALAGMRANKGGPFGAVIVRNGEIIGRGSNKVTSSNDPTAHAEVVAIRDACRNVKDFILSDTELYTTCEPCPMCLSAVYWARIPVVYYSSTRYDAEKIGFDDKLIYEELNKDHTEKIISLTQLNIAEATMLFEEWVDKQDKTKY